ncbi:uncharacterized protein LOC117319295, partial [Pecten maximus]|uniref:uncharacterized protein LOC117319295 n=1 Tax=Pecten maximus TaxID=6579 RepID=UPI001457E5CF
LEATLQTLSGQIGTANMSQLEMLCEQLYQHLLDHSDQMCSNLKGIKQFEDKITQRMATLPSGDLNMNTTVDVSLSILNLVYGFEVNATGCRFSGQRVISYKENPFDFSQSPDHVNVPAMTTFAFNADGEEVPDVAFLMGFLTSSKLITSDNAIDMQPNGTQYMAAFPGGFFNNSPAMLYVNISMMGSCRTYGKYGTTLPSHEHFDFYLHTNERMSVIKSRPYNLMYSFIGGVIQLPIYRTPVIIIAKCQANTFTKHEEAPKVQINQILPEVVDRISREWKPARNVQLIGGRTSEITLKSYFFGTFTASVKMISPDMIDFQSVFLNFSEKLSDTPYVLGTVIAVLIILILTTPILRRLDNIDSALWSYRHLIDNKASSAFHYYICVSTGVRSKRKMESSVYINIIGTRGETGARLLTGNCRKQHDNGLYCLEIEHYFETLYTVCIFPDSNANESHFLLKSLCCDVMKLAETSVPCHSKISVAFSVSLQNFSNGTSSHFCLTTDDFIGNIKTVHIWQDQSGELKSWYLAKVVIIDGKTRNGTKLVCNQWLSPEKGTGHTWCTLQVGRTKDNVGSISEVSSRNIFNDHLWFSLLFRPSYSRFTRVQRLWSLASLLFLSMVASAMFYDTPDDTLPLVKTTHFEIGYKEIYTGLMSSVITAVPSLIMTYVFSKRKLRGENPLSVLHDGDTFRPTGILPWWLIFIGYLVLLICIISGSFFTLLYSLEWGPSLTIKWMSAFLLGTAESVILIEPTKAILLAVLLVCLCSEKTSKHDFHLPPISVYQTKRDIYNQGIVTRQNVDCPCDKPETTDQIHRRYTLRMDRKLNRLLRKFVFVLLYICMLLMIGSQQRVSDIYRQNMHLKCILKPTNEIKTMEGVWEYIHTVVLQRFYPSETYNGEMKTFDELRFVEDNLKMGPLRLRQLRVTGVCTTPSFMRIHGIRCIPDYDTETEDTKNYADGWIPANSTDSWNDVTAPYRYHHNNDKETTTYTGHLGTYGSGGYLIDLDIVHSKTTDLVNNLKNGAWLDERTRVLFIEACLVNRNNMLFTQVQLMFEFPGTGGIFTKTTVVSSNLYPYTNTFDYIILFLQILFVISIFVRFVFVVVKAMKTRCHSLITTGQVIDMFHLGVSVTAIVCLVMRLTSTIAVLNTLRIDIGFYTSFGRVFQWDEYYSISLGMTTFIAILDLLKHLSFNYHIFLMYKTTLAFRSELFQFTIALSVLIVGFACLINLMYGHTESGFRSIPIAILTLFRMTIGMIKFRNDIQVAVIGILITFAVYALVATVCFVNLFVSSLDYKLTNIKQLIKDGLTTFDWHLSGHVWNRLANLFIICGATRPNKRRKKGHKSGIKLQKEELSFCRFLSKVMRRFGEDTDLERTALHRILLRLKRICRRRATPNGTQYRYSIDWAREDDTLIIEFPCDTLNCRIHVDCYTIPEADRQGLIPYGNATGPLSMLFKINLSNRDRGRTNTKNNYVTDGRHSLCMVMIKVPTILLSCRPTFLTMCRGNLGDWCQYTASHVIKEREVYLSATVSCCPQYVMAVTSDLWPGIPLTIQQNNAIEHVLTKKGDVFYLPGLCKKIVFMFPEGCVSLDTDITILLERGEKFPILHVLANGDVSGPIIVQFRRKRHYQPQTGDVPEIKLLTKEGDIEWKEALSGTQTYPSDLSVHIDCLRRGVKTSITASESNFVTSLQRKSDRCLEHEKRILLGVYRKHIPTQNWRKVGRNLGFSLERLTQIEMKKPRTLEEKTCIVLQEWVKQNRGRGLYEIRETWM